MKQELNKVINDIDEIELISSANYEQIFKVYKDDNFYAFNILKTVKIPSDLHEDMYSYVRVVGKTSWVHISQQVYGNIKLWWLVCLTNGILNPVILPEPTTVLRIIHPRYVNDILKEIISQVQQ